MPHGVTLSACVFWFFLDNYVYMQLQWFVVYMLTFSTRLSNCITKINANGPSTCLKICLHAVTWICQGRINHFVILEKFESVTLDYLQQSDGLFCNENTVANIF